MRDRAEAILEAADALYGAITMRVITALFPEVSPARLRHLTHNLVSRGALVGGWAGSTGRRVWLTTRSPAGRISGIRKWIADPYTVRHALAAKDACTIQPPVTFEHAQIAGEVVCGFGTYGRRFDSELHVDGGEQVADGEAWPQPDWRLRIEVERMVRQGLRRWLKSGGLVERIIEQFLVDDGDGVFIQHLIVAPKFGAGHVDFEQELDRLVKQRASSIRNLPRTSGFWFLPMEEIESDPIWHPSFPGADAFCPLPGIAARRASFADTHGKNSEIDRIRKMRAAASKGDATVPVAITTSSAIVTRPPIAGAH